ncbi:hypothetical protein KNV66_gp25 [Bacillus phage DLc1]|uniref:Uncharacterized protein n=1 Tax=Bacillus phage DLc1 TaxID=2777318 RepID=A0A7M1RPR7_9CAUD|nr:hypothetical protein KNV66_gp25 [Bacillus phage DLc1]QOR56278.1 hypothetical protein [Bacillus phage DLc1]
MIGYLNKRGETMVLMIFFTYGGYEIVECENWGFIENYMNVKCVVKID